MVSALIIAVLTALLLCEVTSHVHAVENRIAAGYYGMSATFAFRFASMPIGAASAPKRAPRSNRSTPPIDQIAKVVSTSFNFCKLPKAYREALSRSRRIPEVEDIIRPYG